MTPENPIAPYPEHVFDYLATQEARHWWFRARNKILVWVLRSIDRDCVDFLEVGCGTGYVMSGIAAAFPSWNLEASEYFEDGLFFARQRVQRCHFRQLDAKSMAEAEAYDCIGSFDVLEHIDGDELVLANFFRALRHGGHLLLSVPQHPWLWSVADDYAHHQRRYTVSELDRKVRRAGFKIKYTTSFVSLLLPLMALQRLVAQSKEYSLEDEFKIGPLFNSALYSIMHLEFCLLRLGFRFPAGGSLLLLAWKP